MIQDKVLKIIKGLNTFSQDDILSMSDFEETEVRHIIAGFINDGTVIKILCDNYSFVNKIPERKRTLHLIEKPQKQIIFDSNILFKQAAEDFLINYAQQNCTLSTLKTYKCIICVHMCSFFKNKKAREICFEDIQEFIELKRKEKLSDKTIKNYIALFGKMFSYFKEQGFINEIPYNRIIRPKINNNGLIKVLNKEQTASLKVLARKKYPYLLPLILIALNMGLKKSEILVLTKEDIDLKRRIINVNKTICMRMVLKCKNDRLLREVSIPESLLSVFKELIKGKQSTEFIFKNNRLSLSTFDKKTRLNFRQIAKELGFYDFKFDEFRHTYAYNALQQGMSIDYLHKQLGDYSIQATMDKYRDFIPVY
jgi:integrase